MTERTEDSIELFLRFSRRNMFILLAIVVLLGTAALALMVTPGGAVWRMVSQASLIPVAITILAAALSSHRGRRWDPNAPEVKMVMEDEFRRTNMLRASRIALIVALALQYPLALLFGFFLELPPPRAAMAMAASTVTFGLATLIALFLYFDRD